MSLCTADPFSAGLFAYSDRDVAVDQLHAATAIYTKSNVIDPLLSRIGWPNRDASLFDPSCGDGAFLVRALRMLPMRRNDVGALARIRGWEIHPQAVAEARVNVASQLIDSGWHRDIATQAAQEVILEEDFLIPSRPVESFRAIAGNPPYLRFGNLPDYFKATYGDTLPAHARGDLLHGFLDRCCSLMPPDGAIAFVTADRWHFNCGAAGLRETMGRYLGIDHISRLDPSSSFYRPKDRRRGSLPRIHPVEVVLRNRAVAQRSLSREPVCPDDDVPTSETGRTLQDVCTVTVGPWLGPFGLFVVDETTARSLPSRYLIPAVDTDDLDYAKGGIKRPTKFAIVTERESCPVESIAEHLRRNLSRMPKRGLRSDGRYWIPPEKISEHLDQHRLIIPRITRELKTVVVPPGVLPINHNLSVCATNGHDLAAVREMITCERSQKWFRATADRLENGFFSVKTRTLRRLPV
ncbi:MAG TPA: N-6 DNA methylase [Candidatus Binatia bacterium]|nr:N-6 DNA methylase [Candidatus Binatia bacterium]